MFFKSISSVAILLSVLLISCNETLPTAVTDKEIPTVSIVNPLTNSEWDEGAIVIINVKAEDNEQVVKIELYIDGNMVFDDDTSECSFSWNTSGKNGSHQLLAKAYDSNANIGQSESINVKVLNEAPKASFTVSPADGDTATVFRVDASASSDKEDVASLLQVRWDWEADGTWDTDYSSTKTTEHQYTSDGAYRILLQVKDGDDQTDTTSIEINVYSTDPGMVTDIDGNVYHTVKIGNQWWMVENLRVTKYRNGTDISYEYLNNKWAVTVSGAYCYYGIEQSNIEIYGLLYNFYAVNDSRGIAPEGWHVASDDEWREMEIFLGMSEEEADGTLWKGTNEGGKLKEAGTIHWISPNTGATNESGFTALPGGYRSGDNGAYGGLYTMASFWTSTANSSTFALKRALTNNEARISDAGLNKSWGLSVRCIKD